MKFSLRTIRSLPPPPSRRLGLQNTTYEKRCNKHTLRSRSYFFPENQPKFPDPPPPVSSSPCGRNKKRGRRRPVDERVAPSIQKDPSFHPASRRGFFLIHSSFIIFSSIQNWSFSSISRFSSSSHPSWRIDFSHPF